MTSIMAKSFSVKLLVIIIFFPVFSSVIAQNSKRPAVIASITSSKPGYGKVEINQDKAIDNLLRKYIESNIQKTTITGYRICIFSESRQGIAKTKAGETRTKFIANYPGYEASIRYERPDWRVFVGNFRSRTDAFRLKKQIESMFPNAYILETQIEYSKL
jgi:hypothetical protein